MIAKRKARTYPRDTIAPAVQHDLPEALLSRQGTSGLEG